MKKKEFFILIRGRDADTGRFIPVPKKNTNTSITDKMKVLIKKDKKK